MPFGGGVVNRFHSVDGEAGPLPGALGRELAAKVTANWEDYHALAERDAATVARLTAELGGDAPIVVPELDGDVHDLDGLRALSAYLFG